MKKYNILIVDDDHMSHEVLGEYFSLSGYGVLHAENGKEGISMMSERKPDLVLLDVQMPVMDGFVAMEEISRKPEFQNIPVIFLTSLSKSNLKVKGLELGAEDYIVKPYDRAELMARIKAALRRSAKYRKIDNVIEGKLTDISLVELLQTMELGQKTGYISLIDINAVIYVEKGFVVHSTISSFAGKEAYERIFFLEKGNFSVSFAAVPPDLPRKPSKIQNILLSSMAYIDEVRLAGGSILDKNPVLNIGKECFNEFSELEKLEDNFPLKMDVLITLMSGNLMENTKYLIEAYKKGAVKS